MKTLRYTIVICSFFLISSCSVFKSNQRGCPSNGKNVGAERLLGDEKVPKAKKFKA
jgi:hypothetical protein